MSAVIAAIPVLLITLNVIGFLTLPTYYLTPESWLAEKMLLALREGESEEADHLRDEFVERFHLNVPQHAKAEAEPRKD